MAPEAGKNVEIEFEDGVARLTLARADKLNPLDWSTVRELKDAVAAIDARPDIFAVVVTGRGRSFSAGGDLEGYLTLYRKPDQFAAFLDDFYLMLTGDLLSADDARQIGLLNEVVPAAELDAAVNRLLDKLRAKSRVGLGGAKHLANATLSMDFEAGLQHEVEFVHRYATTEPDAIEGLEAFKDKRKPAFARG